MLGAFKDFGKPATDLNKKEFYDKKASKKATVKSKTADGVSFEGFVTAENKAEFQLNFKDKELEVKNKIDNNATYTVDATVFSVADGFDLKGTFVTPNVSGQQAFFKKMTLGGEYKTADLNASGNVDISFNDDQAFGYKGFGINGAFAFKANDDLTVGGSIAGLTSTSSGEKSVISIPGINFGTTCNQGGMTIACGVNGSFKSDNYSFQPGKLSGSLFQQATPETAIAAQLSFGRNSGDDGFVTEGAPLETSVALGSSYKISSTATLKSKLSVAGTSAPTVDFAWVQKVGNGTFSFSQKYQTESAFGFAYTLDA